MKAIRVLLATIVLALGGTAAPAQDGGDDLYRLQPGDTITIQVLEDSSLDRQLPVQPDGRISFPLAGVIEAGGATPAEVQERIADALSDDFLQRPTVTVSLNSSSTFELQQAGRQPRFYVLGQVANPGQFPLLTRMNVLQALAMAGGPGPFAATGRIQVRHSGSDGRTDVTLFDYDALDAGGRVAEMPALENGDVIFVPEAGLFE